MMAACPAPGAGSGFPLVIPGTLAIPMAKRLAVLSTSNATCARPRA